MSPHHPLAKNGAYTLNRAGKRTCRPELVVSVAGGLGFGTGCVLCSGGVRVVTVRSSGSTIKYAGLTLSVDTVTGRPFMEMRSVNFVRPRTL
jgi:hypothetical protein